MIFVVIIVVAAVLITRAGRGSRRDRTRDVGVDYGEIGCVRGTVWSVARPLGRAEARRLLRHPAFVFGVAITPLMLLAAIDGENGQFSRLSMAIALGLVPLGWMTIIAVNLSTLRPTRTGAEELFVTLPAPGPPRTVGHLLSVGAAGVVAVAFAIVATMLVANSSGVVGSPRFAESAVGVLIVIGGGMVGVLVARWLPHPGWGVAAVVVVVLLQARFLDPGTWPWNSDEANPVRFLAFLAPPTSSLDPALEVRVPGWHLVYLAALVVLVAAVALLRHGGSRPVVATAVVALSLAATAGWEQTRPITATRANAMVDYLTHPRDRQRCEEHGTVRYCAFPAFPSAIDEWRARTEAVLAVLPPAAATRSLEVSQRAPTVIGDRSCEPIDFTSALPGKVRARLAVDKAWPADGQVHPPLVAESFPCADSDDVNHLFTAVQVGAWAVGLPPAPSGNDERCAADGQARAAIALWLGAQATPDGSNLLRKVIDGELDDRMTFTTWDDPPMWGVSWRRADGYAALALFDVSAETVQRVLATHWAELNEPGTPTARIFELLGVAVPPSATAHVGRREPDSCT